MNLIVAIKMFLWCVSCLSPFVDNVGHSIVFNPADQLFS